MKMKNIAILLILSSAVIAPWTAFAIGQVTEPIMISNALRGSEFEETMIIVNTEKQTAIIGFEAGGDIADWVKFYLPSDSKTAVTTTEMQAGSNSNILAVISVPSDIPNGEYKGALSAIRKPNPAEKTEGSSSSVSQKIDREVTVIVQDQETVKLEASVIPKTFDLAKNESLSVRFIYDNQSNISLRPQIAIKINNTAGKTVYSAIFPYPESEPAVKPNSRYEIPAMEIPTSNFGNGKYLAEINFSYNDEIILSKTTKFSVGLVSAAKNNNDSGAGKSGFKISWLFPLLAAALIAFPIIIGRTKKKK